MSLWSKNTAVSHLKAEQSGWTWCSVCLLIISSGALSSPRPHGTQVPMIFGRNSEQNASKQVVFQFPWRRVWLVVPPPVSMTWEPTPGRWQPRCNHNDDEAEADLVWNQFENFRLLEPVTRSCSTARPGSSQSKYIYRCSFFYLFSTVSCSITRPHFFMSTFWIATLVSIGCPGQSCLRDLGKLSFGPGTLGLVPENFL